MRSTDWLRVWAARWCSARTMERVVEPALADVQTEYEAAAQDGRLWRSRWIWITGHAAFLKVLAWVTAERALDALRGATVRDRHALGRTFAVFAAVTALGTGLLTLPPLLAEWSRPSGTIWLGILLIPQAVPLSIPVGLTFGILWGLGRVAASRRSRALVFVAAVVSCVVSFATIAWVMPAANQAYRQSIAGVRIAKGANELTLIELGRLIESGQYATIGMGSPRGRRSVAMAYHVRWALSLAPFVLSVFALVWTRHQRGRVSIVAVGCDDEWLLPRLVPCREGVHVRSRDVGGCRRMDSQRDLPGAVGAALDQLSRPSSRKWVNEHHPARAGRRRHPSSRTTQPATSPTPPPAATFIG